MSLDPASPQAPAVVVRSTGVGPFQQEIDAAGHILLADEPVSTGGLGTGPSPYDLLMAALGACTSMTLRLYADRKGLPLQGVTVRLRHDRVHARDCADCESSDSRVDEISREIALSGPLGDAERARLLQIAEQCPVHRTLTQGVRIRTVLAAN